MEKVRDDLVIGVDKVRVRKIIEDKETKGEDFVADEMPLKVKLCDKEGCKDYTIIMRTPGNDIELTLGFLFTEGIIDGIEDVDYVEVVREGVVEVHMKDVSKIIERNFVVNSSCGICYKSLITGFNTLFDLNLEVDRSVIYSLPEKMRRYQKLFKLTGGIHASAIFSTKGDLIYIHEDVGRHNAVDKVIGKLLMSDEIYKEPYIMQVSGRVGFEIVNKCVRAGIPIISGISAPTSSAIELANATGITLIAFLRKSSFNIYTHPERVR